MPSVSYVSAAERRARRLRREGLAATFAVGFFFGFLACLALYVHLALP